MRKRTIRIFFVTIVLTFFIVQPFLTLAQVMPEDMFVISDDQLVRYQTMNRADIQHFLNSKGGYIKDYSVTLEAGLRMSIADVIYEAAQTHRINPQFLLILLQKEQGLIEDRSPQQSQLDWATGYGCFDNQACNDHWRGIYKQITSASEQFRYYYDHITEYAIQPNKIISIDGQQLIPRNIATAALYIYTPHLQGNRLVKALWTRYFSFTTPDGSLVQVQGDPAVWLIQNGQKRVFSSYLALISRFNPNQILPIQQSELDDFPRGFDIDFAAYSVLRGQPSGTLYLLTRDSKRKIMSPEVFKQLGFNPDEVDNADDSLLAEIPDGAVIDNGDAYPTGTILQDQKTNDIYYVEAGRKYPIVSEQVRKIVYPNLKVSKVASEAIDRYPSGFSILFPDGTLLKGSAPEVYVISNQKKRLITSENVFTSIGYKWKSIIVTSDDVLALYGTGDPVVIN